MSLEAHPGKSGGEPHKTKAGTVAERVVWMTRTSDVVGSHMKTDLESYLTLIRRKIQEKCATTMELITQIRRNKIGESGHVTPNEFRFTLIKFGIILPQPLVDRIFNVFDSDRSGTMDFDEFAMWIMNSEFRPAFKTKKKEESGDSPRTFLRKKFQACVINHSKVFANMKKQVSFLEFVSDINRKGMDLTEREARTVFQTLDPRDTGFVETAVLLRWAESGRLEVYTAPSADKPSEIKVKSLEELILKVVGRNSRQLETAFAHIQLGQGVKIPFEEFRRALLNAGVGKNIHDCRQLFNALSHGSNLADIDLFFNSLSPMIVDPSTEVSIKTVPSSNISASRADRHLRDALRKSFKDVKSDIEGADSSSSGYIEAETLYRILVKRCMPLTFQDFRFILQQIKKEPGSTRIDYHHFLHGYNPTIAPHMLAGSSTLRAYGSDSPGSNTIAPLGVTSGSGHKGPNYSQPTGSAPEFSLHAFDQSAVLKRAKASMKSRGAVDDLNIGGITFGATNTRGLSSAGAMTGGFNTGGQGADSADLKKVWHAVLRECHRSDPDRTGQVGRAQFIGALERANLSQSMSAEAMSKLADTYTLSNGLINYLYLFRSYLSDITGMAATATSSMSKSKSMSMMDGTNGGMSKSIELKPIHPWDFEYKREKHNDPYWRNAGKNTKDLNQSQTVTDKANTLSAVPPPNLKAAQDLNGTERDAVLSQYNAKTLDLCCKCYQLFAPQWRDLRNHFKRAQISSQRGSILTSNFISILEANGILLTKGELGAVVRVFRGLGMQDVVKYDDFLRVCMLVKDRSI